MPQERPPLRRVGPTVYDRLDVTDLPLDTVVTGYRGRAALLAVACSLGYPERTVTPALAQWGVIHVIQVSGDRDAGTVTFAARDGGTVTLTLPTTSDTGTPDQTDSR